MRSDRILKKTEEILPWAINLREWFHRYPELAFEEYQTARFIEKVLTEERIPYSKVGETGIVAVIRGGQNEAAGTIAIRTDMDALPIKEDTGIAYQSRNSNMHACGHDLHMAMVLGAGKILNQNRERLKGTVILIFQPAEEIGRGAQRIIASGKLQHVDAILALHMNPQEKTGIFHTGYGARTSSGCCMEILLEGSEHVVLEAAAGLVSLIEEEMPRLIKTEQPYAFSPTVIENPDEHHIRVSYDGRVFSDDDARQIEQITRKAVSKIETLYPVNAQTQVIRIGGCVTNHDESVKRTIQVLSDLFGADAVKITGPAMFGEDFRCYSSVTDQLVFSMLGGADGSMEYPLHNSKVEFSNQALRYGIAYYLGYIEAYFNR